MKLSIAVDCSVLGTGPHNMFLARLMLRRNLQTPIDAGISPFRKLPGRLISTRWSCSITMPYHREGSAFGSSQLSFFFQLAPPQRRKNSRRNAISSAGRGLAEGKSGQRRVSDAWTMHSAILDFDQAFGMTSNWLLKAQTCPC